MQVVAFLAAVLEKTCTIDDEERTSSVTGRAVLLVVPTSVLHQWQHELSVWAYFMVSSITKASEVESAMNKVQAGSTEVVLVGYDRFRISVEEIVGHEWHLVILDEAHKLKDKSSQLFQAVARLRCPRRFGLTVSLLTIGPTNHLLTNCRCPSFRRAHRFRTTIWRFSPSWTYSPLVVVASGWACHPKHQPSPRRPPFPPPPALLCFARSLGCLILSAAPTHLIAPSPASACDNCRHCSTSIIAARSRWVRLSPPTSCN